MSSSCGFNEANRRRLGQVEQDRHGKREGGGEGGKWTGTDAPQAVDMLRVFRFGIMKIVLVVAAVLLLLLLAESECMLARPRL